VTDGRKIMRTRDKAPFVKPNTEFADPTVKEVASRIIAESGQGLGAGKEA
jgi:hypothetical protein